MAQASRPASLLDKLHRHQSTFVTIAAASAILTVLIQSLPVSPDIRAVLLPPLTVAFVVCAIVALLLYAFYQPTRSTTEAGTGKAKAALAKATHAYWEAYGVAMVAFGGLCMGLSPLFLFSIYSEVFKDGPAGLTNLTEPESTELILQLFFPIFLFTLGFTLYRFGIWVQRRATPREPGDAEQ